MLMMENIQREKRELEVRQQLIQAEKEKERERLSAKSEKEKQELLQMLESMKVLLTHSLTWLVYHPSLTHTLTHRLKMKC